MKQWLDVPKFYWHFYMGVTAEGRRNDTK